MKIFTEKEWEENFDKLCKRAEEGEMVGVIREDGTASVIMPSDKYIKNEYNV